MENSALIFAAVFAAGLGGCATGGVNKGDFNVVFIEEEWILGRQLESDLAEQLDHLAAVIFERDACLSVADPGDVTGYDAGVAPLIIKAISICGAGTVTSTSASRLPATGNSEVRIATDSRKR